MAITRSPEYVFESALAGYHNAAALHPNDRDQTSNYLLAGQSIRFSFANSKLGPYMTRELAHLVAADNLKPDFTLFCWESGEHSPAFPLPWTTKDFSHLQQSRQAGPSVMYGDSRYRMASTQRDNFVIYDKQQNIAVYWIETQRDDFDQRQLSAIREVLHWHMARYGRHLVHAAAVGGERGMVLLTGKSGSGKSTSSLACLNSNLGFCGDDNCYVSLDPDPMVHSFYGSAKVTNDSMPMIPEKLREAIEIVPNMYDKGIIFVAEVLPEKIVLEGPIRSIVSCTVTDQKYSSIRKASATETLLALAPTSLFAFRGGGQKPLDAMAELTRRCSTWKLELGEDTEQLHRLISGLLNAE